MTKRALHSHHGIVDVWENDDSVSVATTDSTSSSVSSSLISSLTASASNRQSLSSEELAQESEDYLPLLGHSQVMEELQNLPALQKEEPSSNKIFFKSKREKWIFIAFIIPPLTISFISMMHMVSLFQTSNVYWMAVTVALAVELASMSSLIALVTLNKLNKSTIWTIFGTLAVIQIFGNMFHSFINMSPESTQTILNLLGVENTPWAIRLVNFLVSGILPIISLSFVKGLTEYFRE